MLLLIKILIARHKNEKRRGRSTKIKAPSSSHNIVKKASKYFKNISKRLPSTSKISSKGFQTLKKYHQKASKYFKIFSKGFQEAENPSLFLQFPNQFTQIISILSAVSVAKETSCLTKIQLYNV